MGHEKYLKPTEIIDSDHPEVIAFASRAVGTARDPRQKAINLYYAVRDGILYDPYSAFYLPEHYRASTVLAKGRGYCVCKACVLCAAARACGIPSRIGFATVRSHIATKNLIDHLGTDLFVYHGFTEFLLDGRWVKATPAFNKELCQRHKVAPLEFDGVHDAVFQAYDMENNRYMEYLGYHGSYADLPLDRILAAWEVSYGKERIRAWIEAFERHGEMLAGDFYEEEILDPQSAHSSPGARAPGPPGRAARGRPPEGGTRG